MMFASVKLGELYKVHNGLSKGRQYFGKGNPFLSFSTVFNNWFLPETLQDFVETTDKEQNSFSIQRGDVFITRTSETMNELGMSSVALKDYPTATYNGFVKRLRPIDNRVLPEYIGYYLRSPSFRSKFLSLTGSMISRASLRNESLLDMEILLPPLDYQKKIASYLMVLDKLIKCNIKQNDNLAEQLQTLFHILIEKSKDISISCLLRDIAQYSSKKCSVSSISLKSYYSTENILPDKKGAIIASSLPQAKQVTSCNPGDTLISNIRPYFKKIVYCNSVAGCSPDVLCITPKRPELSAFLYCSLYDDYFFDYVVSGANGTKMPRGNKNQIMTYPVKLPANSLLSKFNDTAFPILEMQMKLNQEIEALSSLKEYLLPKLFNGQILIAD